MDLKKILKIVKYNISIILLIIYIFILLDNIEPPTAESIDTFMVNLATFLSTGATTDPTWLASVKKAISNQDFSQC